MIETNETILWTRILNFPLDDPSHTLRFSHRLARENNWDIHYAASVTTAYRKFLFLCAVAHFPVTPSDAVDQAWHLHMTYTESYWTDLCRDILGKPLHHNPTKGGLAEGLKFYNQYEATLQLYQEKVNEEPPANIWPPAGERFSDTDFIRINRRAYWLIPRPTGRKIAAVAVNAAAFVLGLFTGNWAFLIMTFIICVIVLAPSFSVETGSSGSHGGSACGAWGGGGDDCGDGGCGSGCGGGCGGGGCGS